MALGSTEVYIVEYHTGGDGTSRKLLCDYAPHFYRLETDDGTEVHLVKTTSPIGADTQATIQRESVLRSRQNQKE